MCADSHTLDAKPILSSVTVMGGVFTAVAVVCGDSVSGIAGAINSDGVLFGCRLKYAVAGGDIAVSPAACGGVGVLRCAVGTVLPGGFGKPIAVFMAREASVATFMRREPKRRAVRNVALWRHFEELMTRKRILETI